MREIANIGGVDDWSLTHYVIEGIDDRPRNKAISSGCTDLTQLKQKLLVYNEICRTAHGAKARMQIYDSSVAQASPPEKQTKN